MFNKDAVEWFGQFICRAFLDVFLENKQPQIVLQIDIKEAKQQIRIVVLDNTKHVLSKEQISEKISALKQKQTDVGFSYTAEGLRVIIVPEEMTLLSGGIAPFGTGAG